MLWNISDEGEADKCNKCYYHIRNISSIRHYITRNDCKTLAHALITSRLDYGLPGTMMTCLQRVQNAAAQLVTCTQKRQHIMPVLNSLQWLPVIYTSTKSLCMLIKHQIGLPLSTWMNLLFLISQDDPSGSSLNHWIVYQKCKAWYMVTAASEGLNQPVEQRSISHQEV